MATKAKSSTVSKGMDSNQYAGFWIRVLASILDGIVTGIPFYIIAFLLMLVTGSLALYYLLVLVYIAFMIYLEGTKGGTPGKLILGLKVVNKDGQVIGIPSAILRYIGKIVSSLILCIGYIMVGFHKEKRGLHDLIADTWVIKTK